MEKKRFLGKKSFCFLTTMVFFMCLLGACHKSNDPVSPPVIPVLKPTYTILGVVTSLVNNNVIKDATVKISGPATAETKTDANGNFDLSYLEKPGVYKLEVTKNGYYSTTTSVNLTGTLVDIAIHLPNEHVKTTAKVTDESVLLLPKEDNSIGLSAKLRTPAGAVTGDKEIKLTQVVNSVPKTEQNKALSLIVLNFQPDGTSFNKPCAVEVSNPVGDYSFENPILELLNPKTNKWEIQSQAVDYDNGIYKTSIKHFSSYKISIPAFVANVSTAVEFLPAIESTDNLNGKKEIVVETVPYTFKRGTVFVVSPEEAAAKAGITDSKVIEFFKSTINTRGPVSAAFTNVTNLYPIQVTIPVGVRMDITGVQMFTTISYNYNLQKGGKTVVATVVTRTAGTVTIKPSLYAKGHTGGSGSN